MIPPLGSDDQVLLRILHSMACFPFVLFRFNLWIVPVEMFDMLHPVVNTRKTQQ